MKTEITYKYKPPEGFHIAKVLVMDSRTIAILEMKYPNSARIDIITDNQHIQTIDLTPIKEFDSGSSYNSFFKFKEGFGLINYTNTIVLWENINSHCEIIKISNPFPPDSFDRKYHTKFASYCDVSNCLYFGIEDPGHFGFPARYWAKLEIQKPGAKWNKLNQLPINLYPETKLRQRLEDRKSWDWYLLSKKTDWLNINDLMVKNERLYIPTDGGNLTRLKSGIRYEYSLMSEFSLNNELIKNHEIIEGIGKFNSSKEFYLLHPRDRKNKILAYNTTTFAIEFEITLSEKQNLGPEKNNHVTADFIGDRLSVFNGNFLNICMIVK